MRKDLRSCGRCLTTSSRRLKRLNSMFERRSAQEEKEMAFSEDETIWAVVDEAREVLKARHSDMGRAA